MRFAQYMLKSFVLLTRYLCELSADTRRALWSIISWLQSVLITKDQPRGMIRRQTSSDAVPVQDKGKPQTSTKHGDNPELRSDPFYIKKPDPDDREEEEEEEEEKEEEEDSKTPLTVIVEPGSQFFTNPEYEQFQCEVHNITIFIFSRRIYPMCSNPRGKALIINNQKFSDPDVYPFRLGANVDTDNLQQLFTQLGFQVIKYANLKRSETMKILIDFADTVGSKGEPCDMLIGQNCTFVILSWLTGTDHCAAVCVLSHGKAQGKIVASDCLDIDIEQDILRRFNNEYCPQLQVFQGTESLNYLWLVPSNTFCWIGVFRPHSTIFLVKQAEQIQTYIYYSLYTLPLFLLRASQSSSSCKPVEAMTGTTGHWRPWTVLTPWGRGTPRGVVGPGADHSVNTSRYTQPVLVAYWGQYSSPSGPHMGGHADSLLHPAGIRLQQGPLQGDMVHWEHLQGFHGSCQGYGPEGSPGRSCLDHQGIWEWIWDQAKFWLWSKLDISDTTFTQCWFRSGTSTRSFTSIPATSCLPKRSGNTRTAWGRLQLKKIFCKVLVNRTTSFSKHCENRLKSSIN